jgi:hypothetical protein
MTDITINGEVAEFNQANFVSGDMPCLTKQKTILSGQVLERFTLMGEITASGKLKYVDSSSSDGSETPYGILVNAVDSDDGDVVADVYVFGHFNSNLIVINETSASISTYATALKNMGIYVDAWVAQ